MELQPVSEERDPILVWGGKDAGVKWPGGAETGSVEKWGGGPGGCTKVVCGESAWGRLEA